MLFGGCASQTRHVMTWFLTHNISRDACVLYSDVCEVWMSGCARVWFVSVFLNIRHFDHHVEAFRKRGLAVLVLVPQDAVGDMWWAEPRPTEAEILDEQAGLGTCVASCLGVCSVMVAHHVCAVPCGCFCLMFCVCDTRAPGAVSSCPPRACCALVP